MAAMVSIVGHKLSASITTHLAPSISVFVATGIPALQSLVEELRAAMLTDVQELTVETMDSVSTYRRPVSDIVVNVPRVFSRSMAPMVA